MGEQRGMVKNNFYCTPDSLLILFKLKDNNLKDEMFLRMIEAMYEDEEDKMATSLVDYDHCANLGVLTDN